MSHTRELIRNFCIIAHIDHGKSTLADRLLELTEVIPRNSAQQFLDKLKVERERGITVQAQTVTMLYRYEGREYLFNLVDTPGHVDFYYEVQRSMRGCQGALLLVDANQGIQAQTLANLDMARKEKLTVLPVLNKIDVAVDIVGVQKEMKEQLQLNSYISRVSAKTGENVESLLARIINEINPPKVQEKEAPLKLFLLNSLFIPGKNVICIFYVMGGTLRKQISITSCSTGKSYSLFDVGLIQADLVSCNQLSPGQIGYAISNMKAVREARIGDTFYLTGKKVIAEPGFRPARPMVFAGVYPMNPADVTALQKKQQFLRSLQKLVLIDPAVSYVRESNASLGTGFKCGFLGMLHMDVFRQRLRDQFDVDAFLTSPSVPYKCKIKNSDVDEIHTENN